MNRRQIIVAGGLGVLAPLAGCTAFRNDGRGGNDGEPLDGEWVLRGRVVNEDDEPREWRVESRSQDRESVGAAWATIPPGESWEFELAGQLYEEEREVYAESERGTASVSWRPTECRRLFAEVTIVNGEPSIVTECREES